MNFEIKDRYNFEDLISIMKYLRAPNGCPWDREQDHKSIRSNFIEETYEVIEAIDTENTELLKEELGDVLLQVVFHAEMESEIGSFNIDDVCNDVCQKLVTRHPHVFGDIKADTSDKALVSWDNVKMQTKSQKSQADAMDSVSRALPSLMRSTKMKQKAGKVGFDWDNVDGAFDKLTEEVAELKEAIAEDNKEHQIEELGDLLFSVVNVARFLKIDSEEALYKACDKFSDRFRKVEQLATERNIDMKTANLKELDSLWDEVKIN